MPRQPPVSAVLSALVLTLALTLTLAPEAAQARRYHRAYPFGLPYDISWYHNYGPGVLPGTFAYYDGPATIHCRQGAAVYIGQDRRRHPCF